MLTISSATPHYRASAAAELQAQKFPLGSLQNTFWRGISLKAWERGYAIERAYHEQQEATQEHKPGYGWAGIFM